MIVSIWHTPNAKNIEVRLDGQPLLHCFYADDERGIAQCYHLLDGHSYRLQNGNLAALELRGRVEFRLIVTDTDKAPE